MGSLLVPKDTGENLDSSRAVRFLWINWRIIGNYPTKKFRRLYSFYSIVFTLLAAIGLPVTLIVNLFLVNGLDELIGNLYLNVTVTLATIKHLTLVLYRDNLLRVEQHFAKLDIRSNGHPVDRKHVLSAIRLCRVIFSVFMILYSLVVIGFSYLGFSKRKLVYNGWYPKAFDNPDDNLTLALCYQNWAIASYFLFQNCNNDAYPCIYLAMVIGHCRALSTRLERIGKDSATSVHDNYVELLRCIQDHKNIQLALDCIRPAISRTMTLQFSGTAFILCLTAVNVIVFEVDSAQLLFTAAYLIAVLGEVFPCSWFVNSLLEEDYALTNALFSCNWYEQQQGFRKVLIIFMQRSQKANLIMAGKLAPVTLQTCLAVIKFSFSMFTLLSQMNIKSTAN